MRILAAAFAGTMLLAGAAQAQDCTLDQLASLPITTLPGGAIAAPFEVNGKQVLLAISLQATHTALNATYAQQMGKDVSRKVVLDSFGFGKYTFEHETVDEIANSPDGTAGVLGADRLHHFDVEFDFKNAKMNVFAKTQCPGPGVVYWSNQYTMVPMQVGADGHVLAQMTLDGKPANVVLSTAPEHIAMRSPQPVKALGIGALSLNNPQVDAGDVAPGADARVGLDELKNLHLFLAFSENKLYVTP
jgi:predicted aspartyl protease